MVDNKDILLVDFNVIMNYDYAILNTHNIIHKLDTLELNNDTYILLENRERSEPLSIFYPKLSDEELYNMRCFLFDNFSEIIYNNLIVNTNIFNVVNECKHNKMVEVTVCCKNEIEQQICKEIFGYNSILDSEVKPNMFDTFMVGSTERVISNMKRYIGKAVYLTMTRYNLQLVNGELVLPEDFLYIILDKVNIRLISLFNTKKEEN